MHPTRYLDACAESKTDAAIRWLGGAVDRAPLASIAVMALAIVLGGMAFPVLLSPQPSCAARVDAAAKSVARVRGAPELGQRLAAASLLCEAGDAARAEGLLAELGEKTRQPGY
ncbi:MAG: hypothetical protein FJX54_13780 [Alphaproteobacteria bacterium]|nr:hypothetical protein [Alphaproteobacteria bacterium]